MRGEILGYLLVGIAGVITALGVQARGWTGDKFQRRVTEAANAQSGWTAVVSSLKEDLRLAKEEAARDLERSRDHARRNAETIALAHAVDQENWRKDKAELRAEIAELQERLADLLTEVYVLKNPPRGNAP